MRSVKVKRNKENKQLSPGRQEFEKKIESERAISHNIAVGRKNSDKTPKERRPAPSGFQN